MKVTSTDVFNAIRAGDLKIAGVEFEAGPAVRSMCGEASSVAVMPMAFRASIRGTADWINDSVLFPAMRVYEAVQNGHSGALTYERLSATEICFTYGTKRKEFDAGRIVTDTLVETPFVDLSGVYEDWCKFIIEEMS